MKDAKPMALLVTSQLNHTVREYDAMTGALVKGFTIHHEENSHFGARP
jgi:hypothetical protein